MERRIPFRFEGANVTVLGEYGYVCALEGAAITDQLQLFEAYGKGLRAPNGYFGENWNAFNDCLMDLQWIEAPEVFIVHRQLPRLSREDAAVYLDILRNAVVTWDNKKTDELHRLYPDFIPHRLGVFFPSVAKDVIATYLGDP